ncbi:Hypothetical protein SCLAV_2435 [Streptomyces clavuligerus]|uniref:Uncharacterized protein n=1 Tax=Streptomyces clavuligerus TaxID=1901 RepID=E2Q8M0_STRCL|nr:Hypothetical protein SCLAV_2435 [Streptomyces clavuligerus]
MASPGPHRHAREDATRPAAGSRQRRSVHQKVEHKHQKAPKEPYGAE